MRNTIQIPDNLDLVARAQLGLNGLMGMCDPDIYYEPYHMAFFTARPAYFIHYSSIQSGVQPKFLEALALLKCMTGSPDTEFEKGFIQSLLDNAGEDGFVYDRKDPKRPWNVGVGYGIKSWNEDYSNIAGDGRFVNALWYMYQLTSDETYKKALKRCAEKLYKVAVVKDDYAYYPDNHCGNDFSWIKGGWTNTDEPCGPQEGCEGSTTFYQTLAVRGLMKCYFLSGDERMLDLSKKLIKFSMDPRFYGGLSEMNPWYGARRAHWYGHTHGNMAAFRGMLDYAIAANDLQVKEFVRDGYEWLRHNICPQLGQHYEYEGCCTGDLVALGIQLTDAGMGDYWDDVDYAVRNALAQAQVTDLDAIRRVGEDLDERPLYSSYGDPNDYRFGRNYAGSARMPGIECDDHVLERSLGSFVHMLQQGRYQKPCTMSCCNANGNQGFYFAWEAAIRHSSGVSAVNLLFTRFSEWLDLISYLPYEGKAVIRNKTSKTINIRIPGSVRLSDLRVMVNGNPVTPVFSGRYVNLKELSGREEIEVTFPLEKRKLTLAIPHVNGVIMDSVSANFIGSTCVGLDDEGENILGSEIRSVRQFNEPKYLGGKTLYKDAPYYVPPKVIQWY